MNYAELRDILCEAAKAKTEVTAFATFTPDGFKQPYPQVARTYLFTSNNKAFIANASGYSIFSWCLDGTENGIRLERYMRDEKGGPDGWKIETCGLVKYMLITKRNGNMRIIGSFPTENMANRAMWQDMAATYGCPDDELSEYVEAGKVSGTCYFGKVSAWIKTGESLNEQVDWSISPVFLTGNDILVIPTPSAEN